jgi:hypothetical protein
MTWFTEPIPEDVLGYSDESRLTAVRESLHSAIEQAYDHLEQPFLAGPLLEYWRGRKDQAEETLLLLARTKVVPRATHAWCGPLR